MKCDVFVGDYDANCLFGYYRKLAFNDLLEEYKAVMECQKILLGGSSNLANTFLSEFADSVVLIMRQAMADRYIDMVKSFQSASRVCLVDCVG